MILPTIYDLSREQHLSHVNVYRVDLDEHTNQSTQYLNITTIPTVQWYFHGNKVDELIGVDTEQLINKTYHYAKANKLHDQLRTERKSTFDHLYSLIHSTMYSNRKLVIDFLVSVFATFILCTTILSISTANWNIDANQHRIGLFQRCLHKSSCNIKELHRTVTLLALFTVILLVTSTLASFLMMGSTTDRQNRCYILVPLALFGAGTAMTLLFMKVHEQIYVNSYSAFIFLIDTVLTHVLGGVSILHGSMFYF
ncbi:unnamed protein product [Adineta ricciae]|uniref:Thioredoxin domain-containing protein n=1 Tax=Adineta ricciae TaxID=249248 RepID=A0A813ZKY1_ADIRI|nr:unnamed protein product [Adineta ricciae]